MLAAGLCGADASTLIAAVHPPIDGVDLGHVGKITKTNPILIKAMLEHRILPVVCSIAAGETGGFLNVNADAAAAATAVALNASALHFITDVEGVFDHEGLVLPTLDIGAVEKLIGTGAIHGGMRPKLQAAASAFRGGVNRILIGENGGTNLVAA